MENSGPGAPKGRWTGRRAAAAMVAIAILAAALLLNRLGAADICSSNEAIEAVFVQRMIEHGEYLFPLQNGATPMYKPPLFHWTAAVIARLFGTGEVTPLDLRLVAALYAFAGIVLAMAVAYGLSGPAGGVLAGLTLVASYQYITLGRFGRVDMTLAFFEFLALASFILWLPARGERGRTPALYLFALALGLAVLSKGPVGAIVPLLAVAAFIALERRYGLVREMLEPGPLIVGMLVASSWYLACAAAGQDAFLSRQLGAENFGRFFGSLGAMPLWYYVHPLLLNSAPLSLLAPLAVVAAVRRLRSAAPALDRSLSERQRAALLLLAIFWIVTVVFFTLAAYKRRAYLLPLWPPAAVVLAWWVQSWETWKSGNLLRTGYVFACLALVFFNFGYIPEREVRDCADDTYRPAAAEILRVVAPHEPLYVYGFNEELAPLQFYLRRNITRLKGRLGDAPPGFVLLPTDVWERHRDEALDLEPVLVSEHGTRRLVLLRRGKTFASAPPAERAMAKAVDGVIVDHSHRLHERVANRRTHE